MAIVEVANVELLEGPGVAGCEHLEAALTVVRAAEGCGQITALQGVERPNQLVVLIAWQSIEHHMKFRDTEEFTRYRELLKPLQPESVAFAHYETISTLP